MDINSYNKYFPPDFSRQLGQSEADRAKKLIAIKEKVNSFLEELLISNQPEKSAIFSQTNDLLNELSKPERGAEERVDWIEELKELLYSFAKNQAQPDSAKFLENLLPLIERASLKCGFSLPLEKLIDVKNIYLRSFFAQKLFGKQEGVKVDKSCEKVLVQVLKSIAEADAKLISSSIHKYDLSEESKVEIAKIAAKQNGIELSRYIKNYRIQSEESRVEIAKVAAKLSVKKKYVETYLGISRYIKNYQIQSEESRVEVAKVAAAYRGSEVSKRIAEYGIEQEAGRIEVAKVVAEKNLFGISKYLSNYEIQSQEGSFEVAKVEAEHNGGSVSRGIKNYRIQSEESRVEIAKIAAKSNGSGVSEHIKNYEIKKPASRFEIAKSALVNSGLAASQFIANYEIQREEDRFKLAKVAIEMSKGLACCFIKHYEILDQEKNYQLFLLTFLHSEEDDLEGFSWVANYAAFQIEFIEKWAKSHRGGVLLDPILKSLELEKRAHHLEEDHPLVLMTLLLIARCTREQDGRLVSWLNNHQSELEHLVSLKNLKKFLPLIPLLFKRLSFNPKEMELYDEIRQGKNFYAQFPLLLLTLCYAEGRLSKESCREFAPLLERNLQLKKEAHLNPLLEALALFLFDSTKTKEELHDLLELILPKVKTLPLMTRAEKRKLSRGEKKAREEQLKQQALENAKELEEKAHLQLAVQGIYSFSKQDRLTREVLAEESKGLFKLFQACFREVVPCKEVDDFEKKYFNIFGKGRQPEAIAAYTAKLKTLNDFEVEKALEGFISDVLEGRFTRRRYRKEGSRHLKQLEEKRPELFKSWQEDFSMTLEEALKKSAFLQEEEPVDFRNFVDRHLGDLQERCPQLFDYFERRASLQSLSELREGIKKKIAAKGIPKEKKAALQNQYLLTQMQFLLVRLIEEKGLDLNTVVDLLSKIENCLTRLAKSVDWTETFKKDLQGLLASMREKRQANKGGSRLKEWKVTETDHFEDLLLCGTEVLGSCQHVSGDPDLNKGLLGYLLDGKNRLIVVKEGSGKIRARALLRLLWKGDEPALFLERNYPDVVDAQVRAALLEAAKEKAKRLGVGLYTKEFKAQTKGDSTKLESLGSPAPFEYVDGIGSISQGSIYAIEQAFQIA